MQKIFVTRNIPGDYPSKLKDAGFDVEVSQKGGVLTTEELLAKIRGVDGILSLLTDKIDGDVMDAAGPQLKIISNYAVGFDNIDIPAATKRGIVVTNTPSNEVNEAVAEHTWALILALARKIVESDEFVRNQGYFAGSGGYKGWEPDLFLGPSVKGKTLGIIGLGRIGSMVASKARGYDMQVLYNKHEPDPEVEKELGIKFASLEDILKTADFISLHVPLTDETRGMINGQSLAKMKKSAYIINTARGPIVDESDLIDALEKNVIAGAALDVFESEPNVNPKLIGMPNVIMTPHIASATFEARNKMGEQSIQAIIDLFKGDKPENLVDEKVWEIRRK